MANTQQWEDVPKRTSLEYSPTDEQAKQFSKEEQMMYLPGEEPISPQNAEDPSLQLKPIISHGITTNPKVDIKELPWEDVPKQKWSWEDAPKLSPSFHTRAKKATEGGMFGGEGALDLYKDLGKGSPIDISNLPQEYLKTIQRFPEDSKALLNDIYTAINVPISMFAGFMGGTGGAIYGAMADGNSAKEEAKRGFEKWSEATTLFHPETTVGKVSLDILGKLWDGTTDIAGLSYAEAKRQWYKSTGKSLSPKEYKEAIDNVKLFGDIVGGALPVAHPAIKGVRAKIKEKKRLSTQEELKKVQELLAKSKEYRDQFPKRDLKETPPLEYEHTTAPKEESVNLIPEKQDHRGLNYEGGIDYPLLGEREFLEAGGTKDAYEYYKKQQELPFDRPLVPELSTEVPKELDPNARNVERPFVPKEEPMGLVPEQRPLDFTQERQEPPRSPFDTPPTDHIEYPSVREEVARIEDNRGGPKEVSGPESAASAEAINRHLENERLGNRFAKIEMTSGKVTPLQGVDVADTRPQKGEAIVKISKEGGVEVVENKSAYTDENVPHRAKQHIKIFDETPEIVERVPGVLDLSGTRRRSTDVRKPSPLGGVGKKQGGAIASPSEIAKAVKELFTKEKKAVRPELIGRLRENIPATMRKDQSMISLEEELLIKTEDNKIYRTQDDMIPSETALSPFQPGAHRNHPIRRWVYGKILKLNQEKLNIETEWFYGPESKGFHKFRKIPLIEHTDKGGLTEFERLVKLNPESADRIVSNLEKYNGIKDPSRIDLENDGLSPQEVKVSLAIRTMLDKIQVATGVTKRPGYLPHMWEGDYRAWVIDKRTGEKFVFGIDNKHFSKLPINKEHYDVVYTKVDHANPLRDADFEVLFKVIDKVQLQDALSTRLKDLISKQGFKSHALYQSGMKGYLGSFEKSAKDRAEARLKSIKMYGGSASRYVAKQSVVKDMVEFYYNRDLENKYPVAFKQAKLDWDLANGELNAVGKAINHTVDDISTAYGGSVNDSRRLIRFLGASATNVKVLMGNVGNIIANKLQPILGAQDLNLYPGGFVSKALTQGFLDYFQLKDSPQTRQMITELERRGVISIGFLRELENPSAAERTYMGEDSTLYKKTTGEKVNTFIEEVSTKKELERTEIQSRLQMALISRRFWLNKAKQDGIILSEKELYDRVENDVARGMGDYNTWAKATSFTNSGLLGDVVSPLSTFATNEINKNVQYLKGTAKGSAKRQHAKALFGYALTGMVLAGAGGNALLKVIDSFIELKNKVTPESPSRTLQESLLANSDIPEVVKVGLITELTRNPITPHGVSFQGSMTQPVTLGGFAPAVPFGLSFGWNVTDTSASITSDLMKYGFISDETSHKFETVAPPILAGWTDAARTERNNMMSENRKGEGRYLRDESENTTRLYGLRSIDEQRQLSEDRYVAIEKQREARTRGVLISSIVKDIINSKEPNQKEIEKYLSTGGKMDTIISSVKKYKINKVTTQEQRIFLDGLKEQEMLLLKNTQDIRQEEEQPQ